MMSHEKKKSDPIGPANPNSVKEKKSDPIGPVNPNSLKEKKSKYKRGIFVNLQRPQGAPKIPPNCLWECENCVFFCYYKMT